jgi:hypothetical protein
VNRDGIPTYDEPGQGCHPWRISLIDDLKITPDPNTHHLKTVEDTAPMPFREYGFKPGPGGLYKYDQNGNLTDDPHNELKIVYNFLNLPQQITKIGGGGGSLQFAYDASGRKWKKEGVGGKREYDLGSVQKITSLFRVFN